jgi:hypothetical protein
VRSPAGGAVDPLRGRRRFLSGIAVGAAVVSCTGLVASTWIKSPRQLAAETQPPAPSLITAAVQREVLSNTLVIRGTVTTARTYDVTATAPYAKAVVTRMPVRIGERVVPGQVLTEIDGRPVILLQGALPAYRDLRMGDTGPDVAQLQSALQSLGLPDADTVGEFGTGTSDALYELYANAGYSAPEQATTATGKAKPVKSAYLPISEVMFLPTSSGQVTAVNDQVGSVVATGPVLQLSSGGLTITATLSQDQAGLVRAGMHVQIYSADFNVSAPGAVVSVGSYNPGASSSSPANSSSGPSQAAEPGYPLTVSGTKPLPGELAGDNVQLTLSAAATRAAVLVVPAAAIFSAADGTTDVIRLDPGQRQVRVPVQAGVSADGAVAITPVSPGALVAGSQVVIGTGQ